MPLGRLFACAVVSLALHVAVLAGLWGFVEERRSPERAVGLAAAAGVGVREDPDEAFALRIVDTPPPAAPGAGGRRPGAAGEPGGAPPGAARERRAAGGVTEPAAAARPRAAVARAPRTADGEADRRADREASHHPPAARASAARSSDPPTSTADRGDGAADASEVTDAAPAARRAPGATNATRDPAVVPATAPLVPTPVATAPLAAAPPVAPPPAPRAVPPAAPRAAPSAAPEPVRGDTPESATAVAPEPVDDATPRAGPPLLEAETALPSPEAAADALRSAHPDDAALAARAPADAAVARPAAEAATAEAATATPSLEEPTDARARPMARREPDAGRTDAGDAADGDGQAEDGPGGRVAGDDHDGSPGEWLRFVRTDAPASGIGAGVEARHFSDRDVDAPRTTRAATHTRRSIGNGEGESDTPSRRGAIDGDAHDAPAAQPETTRRARSAERRRGLDQRLPAAAPAVGPSAVALPWASAPAPGTPSTTGAGVGLVTEADRAAPAPDALDRAVPRRKAPRGAAPAPASPVTQPTPSAVLLTAVAAAVLPVTPPPDAPDAFWSPLGEAPTPEAPKGDVSHDDDLAAGGADAPGWTDLAVVGEDVPLADRTRVATKAHPLGAWMVDVDESMRAAWRYPVAERALGVEGVVVVRFKVRRAGEVVDVRVLRSSGSAALDAAAVAAVPSTVAPPPSARRALYVKYTFRYRTNANDGRALP